MRRLVPTAAILAIALCGCARAPAVQPYGSVVSAGRTRTLSAREVAPMDDFLNRHEPVLGILATPAPPGTDPTRTPVPRQPAYPARDNRQPDLTIR